jgi:hypothetical protein
VAVGVEVLGVAGQLGKADENDFVNAIILGQSIDGRSGKHLGAGLVRPKPGYVHRNA